MLEVGQKATLTKRIIDDDLRMFSALSMDTNPLHLDDGYAEENSLWRKRVAHGSYVASFLSAVMGTKLPGEGTIYLNQNLNFLAPVYLGDEITAEVEVLEVGKKRRVTLGTRCVKQDGTVVIDGTAVVRAP
jgi:3-hydroxybutyryl-CoA dehydratase